MPTISILNTPSDKCLIKQQLSSLLLIDFYRSYYLFVSEVELHKNLEKKTNRKKGGGKMERVWVWRPWSCPSHSKLLGMTVCESWCKHWCNLIYSVRDGKSVQCVHWGSDTHTVRATESSQAVSVYTNVTLTDTHTHTLTHKMAGSQTSVVGHSVRFRHVITVLAFKSCAMRVCFTAT